MKAVAEFAMGLKGEKLGEVIAEFFFLNFDHTETLDAWCIDDACPEAQVVHLGKGSGVLPLQVLLAYSSCLKVQLRVYRIDKSRLT